MNTFYLCYYFYLRVVILPPEFLCCSCIGYYADIWPNLCCMSNNKYIG